MNIYRRKHTPYTYLIGWSWLDIWYYGRRTKRGCHPDDLWVSYFTSSKEVERLRKLHGEPDIIIIKKTFETHEIDKCALWEHKVLRRLDARNHPKMINKNNGDDKWDTTGMFAAILVSTGEYLGLVSVDDPRKKTGEIKAVAGAKKGGTVSTKGKFKGMKAAILVSTGEKLGMVSLLDPRWKTGEIICLCGHRGPLKKPRAPCSEEHRKNLRGPRGPQKNPSLTRKPRGPMSEEQKEKHRKPRGPMSEEQKELRRKPRGPRKKKEIILD